MTIEAPTPVPIRLRPTKRYVLGAVALAAAATAASLAITLTGGTTAHGLTTVPGEKRAANAVYFGSLTPTQLRAIRHYELTRQTGPSPQEQRYANAISSLTPSELRAVRFYWAPSPALTAIASLTPAQLRSIRWYWVPASK